MSMNSIGEIIIAQLIAIMVEMGWLSRNRSGK